MSNIIQAIFEHGVFRPIGPVDLPERTRVEFEPRVLHEATGAQQPAMSEGLSKIYGILGERYDSGHTDTAERHNEHQP